MIVCGGVSVFGTGTQIGRLFVREITSKFEIVSLVFLPATFGAFTAILGAFNDVVCCYTER